MTEDHTNNFLDTIPHSAGTSWMSYTFINKINETDKIIITNPSENQKNSKPQPGAIAVIVIGAIILVVLIAFLVIIVIRKIFASDSWSNASFDEGVLTDVSQFPVANENTNTFFELDDSDNLDESDIYSLGVTPMLMRK